MTILIDNGHGEDTPGKRSPDGRLREYKYAREIADAVCDKLTEKGYDAICIVGEEQDIPLSERVRRVNEICRDEGADNVLLVSIHCNAAGNGSEWMNARGWSAYTTKGETKSDTLASYLYAAAKIHLPKDIRLRMDNSDGDEDWEENFYILRRTQCAAVLTENLFQDNRKDVDFLLSEEGREAIVNLHVDGIESYINSVVG